MKSEQIGPTFIVPEKTVTFFGVKPVVPSSTLKMRKSHKKIGTYMCTYTYSYTQTHERGANRIKGVNVSITTKFSVCINNQGSKQTLIRISSCLHCTMGQAMEIDILEIHKRKKLLRAHFFLKIFLFFCKWC